MADPMTALAEVLTRERDRLTRFARRQLTDSAEQEAEDVVADAMLGLIERADLLAEVENLTAYLFRAVANRLVDRLRRHRPTEELSPERADDAPTPDQMMDQARLRQRLDQALNHLSPAERDVWVAVEVEGYTFRELADRWGEPIGTLLSRKNRARKTLKTLMAAEEPMP